MYYLRVHVFQVLDGWEIHSSWLEQADSGGDWTPLATTHETVYGDAGLSGDPLSDALSVVRVWSQMTIDR